MYIVFFSIVLNHHQAPISDALWEATKHRFTFVELAYPYDKKGANNDYSQRPYLLQAWQSNSAYSKAMELACTAECCIFSGVLSLPFQKKRMKKGEYGVFPLVGFEQQVIGGQHAAWHDCTCL